MAGMAYRGKPNDAIYFSKNSIFVPLFPWFYYLSCVLSSIFVIFFVEHQAADSSPVRREVVLLGNVKVELGFPDEKDDHCETGNISSLISPVACNYFLKDTRSWFVQHMIMNWFTKHVFEKHFIIIFVLRKDVFVPETSTGKYPSLKSVHIKRST